MNVTKLTLAALLVGASLTPALADSGDTSRSPLAVFQQAHATPAEAKMVEGRQATPIVAPAAVTGAERYLDGRIDDQTR